MTDLEIRQHVQKVVLAAVSKDEASRAEALRELLVLTMQDVDEASAEKMSNIVPVLPDHLYNKWTNLCVDRMFETVPRNQIIALCEPSQENEAALVLVYLMFMESARMEELVNQDLIAHGLSKHGEELSAAFSALLEAKLSTNKAN